MPRWPQRQNIAHIYPWQCLVGCFVEWVGSPKGSTVSGSYSPGGEIVNNYICSITAVATIKFGHCKVWLLIECGSYSLQQIIYYWHNIILCGWNRGCVLDKYWSSQNSLVVPSPAFILKVKVKVCFWSCPTKVPFDSVSQFNKKFALLLKYAHVLSRCLCAVFEVRIVVPNKCTGSMTQEVFT